MAPTPISKYFQSKPSSSGIKAKASSSISIEKKKRTRLSVAEKLQLLKKYEAGVSVKSLCEEYGIKKQTVHPDYCLDHQQKYQRRAADVPAIT